MYYPQWCAPEREKREKERERERERERDEREREREREREGGEGREIKGGEKKKNGKHFPILYAFLYHAVLQRRPDEIDKRASDMYSFAVILWEITTGKKPYAGLSPMMAGFKVNTATSVED